MSHKSALCHHGYWPCVRGMKQDRGVHSLLTITTMDGPRVDEAHCMPQDEEELMNRAINRHVITRNVSRNENDERW